MDGKDILFMLNLKTGKSISIQGEFIPEHVQKKSADEGKLL